MKVKIIKQVGQTGLKSPGTIVDVNPKTAKHWIKFGWAKKLIQKKELKTKRETKEMK